MKRCGLIAAEDGKAATAEAVIQGACDSNTTVPKHIGFEIELGNHLVKAAENKTAVGVAAALVEAHHRKCGGQTDGNSESAREFDDEGFRVYRDHEHAEICSMVVPSATRLVLAMREVRKIVGACKRAAEEEVGPLRVTYNNTNRHGVAWAFHGNFLVARLALDKWREDDWVPLKKQWVPFLVTSLPLFGTGKVGAENGTRSCEFQLSQRADFIGEEVGLETVASKNLVNTRDEPLADPERYARLHVIAWDTNLCEFANWLKFGVSQVLLALIEEGVGMPDLALAEPIKAMRAVSRDLKLRKRLRLQNGQRETALGVQRRLAEAAAQAIKAGCAACQVPDAELIVGKWMETIEGLEARSSRLSRRLDWCAKLQLLRRAQELRNADRQQMQMLDLGYAEVGGLFEKRELAGGVDRLEEFVLGRGTGGSGLSLVPREQARAALVRRFRQQLACVDWDHAVGRDETGKLWLIPMDDPLDSQELLAVVSSAEDWGSCLNRLIEMDRATAIVVCGVLCESGNDGEEQNEEELSVQ